MKERTHGGMLWPVAAFVLIGQLLASESSHEATELEVVGGIAEATPIRFVPPPAPEPMPEIPVRVSAAVDKGTHRLTLQRGAPSTLPDIPAPVVRLQEPARISEDFRVQSSVIGMSVTVYDRSISHLEWRDPQTGEALEAWCGWDFSLLGPMHEFAGEQVRFWMLFSPIHIDSSALTANQQSSIPDRSVPENDDIQFVKGDASVQAGRRLLEAVQRYVVANQDRLEQQAAARQLYRLKEDAWKRANPPRPLNHTIALRPHRGSRYLTQETDEAVNREVAR